LDGQDILSPSLQLAREETFLEMKLQKYVEIFCKPTFEGEIFGHEISMSTSSEQP